MRKSYLEILSETQRDDSEKSPLRALIESNRRKRIRKSREKLLEHIRPSTFTRPRAIEKTGTLIVGIRCEDGIVIGSDKKTIRGGETQYSRKIFEVDIGGKVLFAAEGLTGIRDDFFLLLNYEVRRRRGVDTFYEVKIIVEDIIAELTERYSERLREPRPIGVLMGGLEQLSEGKAILYYIHSEGYGERVDFRCTGHGGGYAYSLAKFLCGPHLCQSLSAEDIAKRVAFVISWVAEDVDSTVGGDPDVFIIRDRDPEAEQLPEDKIQKEIEHARKAKEDFSSLLFPQE